MVSGEASRQLVIIPDKESFVKALGESMVLTCKVVTSDGRPVPAGSLLRWLYNNSQEIVAVNGRFDFTCILYNGERIQQAGRFNGLDAFSSFVTLHFCHFTFIRSREVSNGAVDSGTPFTIFV